MKKQLHFSDLCAIIVQRVIVRGNFADNFDQINRVKNADFEIFFEKDERHEKQNYCIDSCSSYVPSCTFQLRQLRFC